MDSPVESGLLPDLSPLMLLRQGSDAAAVVIHLPSSHWDPPPPPLHLQDSLIKRPEESRADSIRPGRKIWGPDVI